MADPTPRAELRALLRLGLPVSVTQLGVMLLGVVDTMMVGHLGTTALDAAALGSLWVWGTAVFGIGLVLGMDPIVSQAHGAGERRRVALALQRGLVVALLVTPPLWLSWWLTEPSLLLLGQSPALAAQAGKYVEIQVFSLLPFLAFFALRQYLQGRGIVAPAMVAVAVANVFNAGANWVLIYGHFGFPAMGLEGAGLATGLTRCVLLLSLALYTWGRGLHRGAWERPSMAALELRGLLEIVRHGVPVGVQYGLETWAFQISTLVAGTLGEATLAGHVIALNLASLSFMMPLGISQGASTRVGNLIGAGMPAAARRSAVLALALGAGVMVVSAVLFVVLRHELPALYTSDPEVVAVAAGILPIAAAFQLFDGTQGVGGGVLRGAGSTRPAAVFNLVGYYVIALPLAALAVRAGMGVHGLWWGLCLGVALVAVALVWWIRRRAVFERSAP
jgi:multidrug resistance protein, MATE family